MRMSREPIILASQWLVLALVIERPSHAYEIGIRYERRFGSFAPTAQNAAYKALDRLSEHGLVTSSIAVRAPGGRGAHGMHTIYKASPAGIQEHRRWLVASIRPRHWRTELLAKIATGAVLGRGGLLTLVGLYEQMTVAHGQQIVAPPQDESVEGLVALIRELIAQEQRAIIAAQLDWAKDARDQLQRIGA